MQNNDWDNVHPDASRAWAGIEQALQTTTQSRSRKKEHVCRAQARWSVPNKQVQLGKYVLTVDKVIGSGQYGIVYRVRDADGKFFTLKRIKLVTRGKMISAVLEYRAFERIKHLCMNSGKAPSMPCPLLIGCVDSREVLLLLTYIPGTMLGDALMASKTLPVSWPRTQMILAKLAESVAQLHSVGVAHLDLRPNNFILHGSTPYLIDMGLSCTPEHVQDCSLSTHDMTPYLDPNFVTAEGVKPAELNAADVFALGALFRDVLDNYTTRLAKNGSESASSGRTTTDNEHCPWELVDAMQYKDPRRRPSAARVAAIVRSWPPTHPPTMSTRVCRRTRAPR